MYVNKTPLLNANRTRAIGILVCFYDIHSAFCYEGMTSRWLRRHLPRALELAVKGWPPADEAAARTPHHLRMAVLQLAIINWIRQAVLRAPMRLDPTPFALGDFLWMEQPIRDMFPEVVVEFRWPDADGRLSGDIRLIEAIVLVLIMNGYESSVAVGRDVYSHLRTDGWLARDRRPTIEMSLAVSAEAPSRSK